MFSKESEIIKKSITDYLEKAKVVFKGKYSPDDLESDFFTYSISEESESNINFKITLSESFKLRCIVNEGSNPIKGYRSIAFIVSSTMSYESFKASMVLNKTEISDIVNTLNTSTCGIKTNIIDHEKLVFSFTSDFFMNFGILNETKLYRKLFMYNLNNALKEVTIIADELAKLMGISE